MLALETDVDWKIVKEMIKHAFLAQQTAEDVESRWRIRIHRPRERLILNQILRSAGLQLCSSRRSLANNRPLPNCTTMETELQPIRRETKQDGNMGKNPWSTYRIL